jgi:regulator of cell morphogenesis and NO signaling
MREYSGGEQTDWSRAPVPLLLEHILEVHHRRLRQQMAQMRELWGEVRLMDAWRCEKISKLEAIYWAFQSDLVFHITKEERMVFPTIRRVADAGAADPDALKSVIDLLAGEHGHGNALMEAMRQLTGQFEPYEDASASYRAMMECLKGMQAGLGPHEELEDLVLFPRILAVCRAYNQMTASASQL